MIVPCVFFQREKTYNDCSSMNGKLFNRSHGIRRSVSHLSMSKRESFKK